MTAALGSFGLMLGSNMPTGLYVPFSHALEFDTTFVSLTYVSYFVALLPTLLLFGGLADRIGPRRVAVIGLTLGLAASLTFVFAAAPAWLLVARILQGMAWGLSSGALSSVIIEAMPARGPLVSTATLSLGAAAGPLIGGTVVISALPWPGSPFAVVGLVLLVALSGVASFARSRRTAAPFGQAPARAQRKGRFAINAPLLVGSGLSALGWGAAGFSLEILPSAVDHVMPNEHTLATIAVTILLTTSLAAQLLGLCWTVLLRPQFALIAVPLGSLATAASLLFTIPELAYAGAFIGGLGLGCAFVTGATLAAAGATDANRSATMSMFFSITQVSSGLPAFIIGFAFAAANLRIGAAVLAILLVGGAVALWIPIRRVAAWSFHSASCATDGSL